jgi:citrate lyase subunit beta / citryl-CoA lyase
VSCADAALHRSYLYAPGSEPRVMRKALAAGADAVVLDLEDAVVPSRKAAARAAVADLLDEVGDHGTSPSRHGDAGPQPETTPSPRRPAVHVRINRDGHGYALADLDAAVRSGLDAIRLPKAEAAVAVREVADAIGRLERERHLPAGRIRIYPTVESALGAVSIADVLTATPRVVRAAIGTADLLADLGAHGDDDLATLHVRSHLVLMSRVAGVGPPIDSVHTDLEDLAGLSAAAQRARSLGFFGKSAIHPRQLDAIHAVFTPSDAEFARAERVVAALDAADQRGSGALEVDGEFVDAAVVARARALLALRR